MRQIVGVVTAARFKMGLPTRAVNARVGDHSNALVENAIQRVRSLAGSFKPPTTWAARPSAWTLNRYQATKGITPFEVVYQKSFVGRVAEFAEPVYAKWYTSLFLGKPDGQDSFLVFNGNSILLTRSIRELLEIGSWAWRCTLIVKHSLGSINLVLVPELFQEGNSLLP